MPVLFNPTNEEFRALYIGVEHIIAKYPEKGHKVKMDDAAARHILNNLSPRGLCKLEYGDEDKEKEIAEQGRRRNIEFKKKQVVMHNNQNEFNKQSQLAFIEPSPKVREYANELGLELLEPYALSKSSDGMEDKQEVARLRKKERLQSEQITDMANQMGELQKMVAGLLAQNSPAKDKEAEKEEPSKGAFSPAPDSKKGVKS